MFLYFVSQQETHTEVAQDGSQCARSDSDGGVLPGDLGDRHLGVYALQEGGEEVHGGWHGDNLTGWTQHQLASRHLHAHW